MRCQWPRLQVAVHEVVMSLVLERLDGEVQRAWFEPMSCRKSFRSNPPVLWLSPLPRLV